MMRGSVVTQWKRQLGGWLVAGLSAIGLTSIDVLPNGVDRSYANPINSTDKRWWQKERAFDVHDYIWATLEPALRSIATTVHEELPEISMSIDHYKSSNYPFSVNVEFRTKESELAAQHPLELYRNFVFISLDCGISWESVENLSELYCKSNAQRIRDEMSGPIFFGPARYIDLSMNDAEVKHELDVWVASAANFVRLRLGSIPQDLSTPSHPL